MAESMRALKQYVVGADSAEHQFLAEDLVSVQVSHNYLKANMMAIRLSLSATIDQVKDKLYRHTGTPPEWQVLVLKSPSGEVVCEMSEGGRLLSYYGVKHDYEIKVVDTNPHSMAKGGGLEDVSLIKKYVMSEEDYEKRAGTVRAWKKEQLAKDPNWKPPVAQSMPRNPATPATEPTTAEEAAKFEVGARCETFPGGKRGEIAFIGETKFAPGYWIGVVLDEPCGNNDGSVSGVRYFECEDKFGKFLKAINVKQGDYPDTTMQDLEAEDDEESEGEL
jgi:tubulin-folding cofactor B